MNELNFHRLAEQFLILLSDDLLKNKVEIKDHWDIDHLCYRCDSQETYEILKSQFLTFSELLIESEVNGRDIATFKLHRPVMFKNWIIDLVELPAPKRGKFTTKGFEHIEVVCDVPFLELMDQYQYLVLDSKGLTKEYNQELEICLGERNIKFHHLSLASVINLEKNTEVWMAVQKLGVLKDLKLSSPLIIGIFPEVHIILCSKNKIELNIIFHQRYGNFPDFKISRHNLDSVDSLICQFVFEGVTFKLVAQELNSVRQLAHKRFQQHERELKYGNSRVKHFD